MGGRGLVRACMRCGADAAAQRMFFMHYLRPEELEALRGSGGEAGVEAALSKLSAEANIWALASHAYWGVWALIQVRCRCTAVLHGARGCMRYRYACSPHGARRNTMLPCRGPRAAERRLVRVACLVLRALMTIGCMGAACCVRTARLRTHAARMHTKTL